MNDLELTTVYIAIRKMIIAQRKLFQILDMKKRRKKFVLPGSRGNIAVKLTS